MFVCVKQPCPTHEPALKASSFIFPKENFSLCVAQPQQPEPHEPAVKTS